MQGEQVAEGPDDVVSPFRVPDFDSENSRCYRRAFGA